jgi:hypothetical protein
MTQNLIRARRGSLFTRMERDGEYRRRLCQHPKAVGLVLEQARVFCGSSLDAVGDYLDCPRRIVEDMQP